MRTILRRMFLIDPLGKVRSVRLEQLTDHEDGTVEEDHAASVQPCQACGRPLEKISDIRGVCVRCGRSACVTCESFCAICHRPQCGYCRTGFPEKGLSVCEACLPGLQERLARQDRLSDSKIAFEQHMAVTGARMKLFQFLMYGGGSIFELLAQIGLARTLSRMERNITKDQNHGKRLLE